jgi:hypothetical protein
MICPEDRWWGKIAIWIPIENALDLPGSMSDMVY